MPLLLEYTSWDTPAPRSQAPASGQFSQEAPPGNSVTFDVETSSWVLVPGRTGTGTRVPLEVAAGEPGSEAVLSAVVDRAFGRAAAARSDLPV